MTFVHLHGHSEKGSVLDACASIKKIVQRAKEKGMPAIALTEHGTMASFAEFYFECKKQKVKPLLGCEFYIVDDKSVQGLTELEEETLEKGSEERKERVKLIKKNNHVGLIAMNNEGLKNLFKLVTDANKNGFYGKPRTDWKTVEKHNEGLIILSGCTSSKFNSYIAKWPKKADDVDEGDKQQIEIVDDLIRAEAHLLYLKSVFGDRLYGEVQVNGSPVQKHFNKRVIELCKKNSIPLVVTNDYHYVDAEDVEVHRMWKYIAWHKVYGKGKEKVPYDTFKGYGTDGHFVASYDEVRAQWEKNHLELGMDVFDEAAANTLKVADRCDVSISDKITMPKFPNTPVGMTEKEHFRHLIYHGFKNRKIIQEKRQKYIDRIKYEIEVIESMGYIGYFLIVQDALNWCRDNSIGIGLGRGSSGGSLVCYLLGIVEVDPIKYPNLQFERFLNKERKKLPDIDMDICKEGRGRLIEYLRQTYGEDNVATVVTYSLFTHNTILRDIGSVMDLPYQEVNVVAKALNEDLTLEDKKIMPWEEKIKDNDIVKEFVKKYPFIENYMKLSGGTRNYGTHAGAVVIANDGISNHAPVMRVNTNGEIFYNIQVDKDLVEPIGLIKFDFLGLETVTILDKAAKSIGMKRGIYDLFDIEPNDDKVFEMFRKGDTYGVFQFMSPGMTELTERVKPVDIEDVTLLNALYRPAVLQAGVAESFVNRRNGDEGVDFIHPSFVSILERTYGLIVYQEQAISILNKLGLNLGEADIMRRDMEKVATGAKDRKVLREWIDKMKERNFNGNYTQEEAKQIIEQLLSQVGYSFNYAHSLMYSLLGYYCQWMKCYHPGAFVTAYINAKPVDKQKDMIDYLKNKYDYRVEFGTVNNFTRNSEAYNDKALYYGLSSVKGLSEAVADAIIDKRQFTSFRDFLYRIDRRIVNKTKVIQLIELGFFDNIPLIETSKFSANARQLLTFTNKMKALADDDDELLIIGEKFNILDYNNRAGDKIGQFILEMQGGMTLEDLNLSIKGKVALHHLSDRMKYELWKEVFSDPIIKTMGDYTIREKSEIEKKYLTFNVRYDIMDLLKQKEKEIDKYELDRLAGEENYWKFAIVSRIRTHQDKNGNQMAFIGLRGVTGDEVDVTVFSRDWKGWKKDMKEGTGGVFFLKPGARGSVLTRYTKIGW